MADKGRKRVPGKFCVEGGPRKESCTNTNATPGLSIYLFPKDEAVRRQWVNLVHKHRPDFKATNTSVLCSVHFAPACFTRRLDLADSKHNISGSHDLERGSIPKIDALVEQGKSETTDKERRMVEYLFSTFLNYTRQY